MNLSRRKFFLGITTTTGAVVLSELPFAQAAPAIKQLDPQVNQFFQNVTNKWDELSKVYTWKELPLHAAIKLDPCHASSIYSPYAYQHEAEKINYLFLNGVNKDVDNRIAIMDTVIEPCDHCIVIKYKIFFSKTKEELWYSLKLFKTDYDIAPAPKLEHKPTEYVNQIAKLIEKQASNTRKNQKLIFYDK